MKGEKSDIRDDVFHGTFDEVLAFFKEMNWSDGLPIVPPTFGKVNEYMKYSPRKWDETVAVLPPANRDVKAWHVAVNAAMSETAPFCDSTPSSCMRAAMKDATRTKTMIAEAMPHIGAIRLPPPSSFAKNAISG